jgi:hypothetical protein
MARSSLAINPVSLHRAMMFAGSVLRLFPSTATRIFIFRHHHVGPTGLRLISFLNPPFFCSGALDSGENEGGIWLISVLDPDPPPYELKPPLELFVGSDSGGGENCGKWFAGGPGVVCCCGGR